VKQSSFKYLKDLEILDLSYNSFLDISMIANLLNPFKGGHLNSLILSQNSYTVVPYDALESVIRDCYNTDDIQSFSTETLTFYSHTGSPFSEIFGFTWISIYLFR